MIKDLRRELSLLTKNARRTVGRFLTGVSMALDHAAYRVVSRPLDEVTISNIQSSGLSQADFAAALDNYKRRIAGGRSTGDPLMDAVLAAEPVPEDDDHAQHLAGECDREEAEREAIENPCACGADKLEDYTITATMIECRKCGRLWGRVNGRWVLDPDTDPDRETEDIDAGLENRSPVATAPAEVWDVVRAAMVRAWGGYDGRIQDIANENFGPFPVQTPSEAMDAIEDGIARLRGVPVPGLVSNPPDGAPAKLERKDGQEKAIPDRVERVVPHDTAPRFRRDQELAVGPPRRECCFTLFDEDHVSGCPSAGLVDDIVKQMTEFKEEPDDRT